MSKIDELREKYPSITSATFNKLVKADTSPTKKYLPFLLKSWSNKTSNGCPSTTDSLIKLVKSFDELIPYIPNKDIYSPDYNNLGNLFKEISLAEQIKEDKLFVREENTETLIETDSFLFIRPTTFKGSLKYGSGTKWCTASKKDPETFKSYTKDGLLVYLIDKTNSKSEVGRKIALYHKYSESSLNNNISIYNTIDSHIYAPTLENYGWDFDELISIFTSFKIYHNKLCKIKKSQKIVNTTIEKIKSIDFNQLYENINLLNSDKVDINFEKIENIISEFNSNVKKLVEYGYSKTES